MGSKKNFCKRVLEGINHTQRRMNKPLSFSDCCLGDALPITVPLHVCGVLVWCTSHLENAWFVKETFNQIIVELQQEMYKIWPNVLPFVTEDKQQIEQKPIFVCLFC